ncbi:MAG TPA: hypothetical protein VN041_17700 [Microbacterium sp.]|nr:hypothetical protein [Microbacterium sp.]
MADQQTDDTTVTTLAAPPSLQLLHTDADAGLCTDGYCVLPGSQAPRPAE